MKINLLLIDDDQISLLIAKKYLVDQGINNLVEDLILFTNANDAVELLLKSISSENQDIFWILLDINMPFMNGWEFLKLVENKKLQSKVKVVMLTSSISEVDIKTADSFDNVYGYFPKPMNQEKCEDFKVLIQGTLNFKV